MLLFYAVSAFDTSSNGIFIQKRVGQFGRIFRIIKLRTIDKKTFTISKIGRFLRKSKIDEVPQLLNVFIGDMSFVGPRPDIPGYYDQLKGNDRLILNLKPGITSLASIKYKNEEQLLAQKHNPLQYNDTVIFPDKVRMNLDYYYNRNFLTDLKILIKTFI